MPAERTFRGEWRACLGAEAGAYADRREAEAIATRSRMRLHVADLFLMRVRHSADRNPEAAREYLGKATTLVADTGYHRRDAEIIALECFLSARTA